MDTKHSYIGLVERGGVGIGIDNIEKYADFFDVDYYQFVNPDFPIPKKLPAESLKKIKAEIAKEKALKEQQKEANKNSNKPRRATQLHGLIAEGFFKKAKTAESAFLRLHPEVSQTELTSQHKREIALITDTLKKGKFKNLLERLDAFEGHGRTVRFVEVKKSGKVG